MTDLPLPARPSLASLAKALVIASAIAALLLVPVVLPAERNIDITGFGKAIGLTALSAPPPVSSTQAPASEPEAVGTTTEDQTVVDLPPGKGLEYKFHVRAGAKLEYEWKSDAGEVFYDFHGEPKGAAKDVFESFAAGNASGVKGTLTAPFEGTHGWYWKNRGTEPVRITLITSGAYEVLGLR